MDMPVIEDKGVKWYDFQKSSRIIHCIKANELKYHTSWDWTIPVCKKVLLELDEWIHKIKTAEIVDGDILHNCKLWRAELLHAIQTLDLNEVYANLIEPIKGINYYNQQSK
jgi:hypothetical protein